MPKVILTFEFEDAEVRKLMDGMKDTFNNSPELHDALMRILQRSKRRPIKIKRGD